MALAMVRAMRRSLPLVFVAVFFIVIVVNGRVTDVSQLSVPEIEEKLQVHYALLFDLSSYCITHDMLGLLPR